MQFRLNRLPQIHFGPEKLMGMAEVITHYGRHILLLTGGDSFTSSPYWQILGELLENHAIDFSHERIVSEPSPQVVDAIVERYRKENIDVVVAIGGGSVLDAGKGVSAMLPLGEPVGDFLEGVGTKSPDGRKIPFIAVPTTSGTGSEVTSNAVISQVGSQGYKKSLRHDGYVPDCAIVDPLLTLDCPQSITTNSSLDAFSQLVESYLSTAASPYTDDLSYGALKLLSKSFESVCKGEGTLDDRSNMSYGAMISGITLCNCGLGAVHGFASVIGGLHAIPHGAICGTLMAVANEVTLRRLRKRGENPLSLHKYARLGRLFSAAGKKDDVFYQDSFIQYLHQMTIELQVPSLGFYGVQKSDLDIIARKSGYKNNPSPLDDQELAEILTKTW